VCSADTGCGCGDLGLFGCFNGQSVIEPIVARLHCCAVGLSLVRAITLGGLENRLSLDAMACGACELRVAFHRGTTVQCELCYQQVSRPLSFGAHIVFRGVINVDTCRQNDTCCHMHIYPVHLTGVSACRLQGWLHNIHSTSNTTKPLSGSHGLSAQPNTQPRPC
jgi:hypothetical protein